MKQIKCEMCGSTDMIKQDGVFVCQNCGCKYTLEEARKLMVEVAGTVEVTGTVQVDNTHLIQNYLEMAKSALNASNNTEAENYCNKIIEIDPDNYEAWMVKGEAAAWQSSLVNSRVNEGVLAFAKGIENAPEEKKEELTEHAENQLKRLSLAMITLRADRFAKWPDKEESDGFIHDLTAIMATAGTFILETKASISLSELLGPIATQINQSAVDAWKNVVWPEYNGDPNDADDRPDKFRWQRLIERIGYCTTLIEKAIKICNDNDEANIQRYENLIFLQKAAIDSCSWKCTYTDWGTQWYKEWSLTDAAKNTRRQWISQYEEKIKLIKRAKVEKENAEKSKRKREYWAAHAEEREQLLSEKATLTQKIEVLESKKALIPGNDEKIAFIRHKNDLIARKNALGKFKGKEKQALQNEIDNIDDQIELIERRMYVVKRRIQDEIDPLQRRIKEIDAEFSKDR